MTTETNSAATAVRLTSVTKRFGDFTAVDNIDLEIANGEFFSLLGPSGCGKTTTLRMIAGFEYPTIGTLAIGGKEMGLDPPDQRPVNTVFQNYALFPHMNVLQNVMFGLLNKKVPKAEAKASAEEAISLVQLGPLAKRKPSQLSGGQQQRVALARALVNKPQVLLLDEPLGALDLKLRQEMQSELTALHSGLGIAFVYVTHDQEEALTMSDRIGVMHDGALLQVGTPTEIYERPSNRFVADFIGEINLLEGAVAADGAVSLGDTTIRVAQGGPAPAGRSATIAIRPESIDLSGADDDIDQHWNQLSGTVERRVYFGDAHSYDIATPGGTVAVRQDNRPRNKLFEPGDPVTVSWAPEATNVLED
jgi:spermidine/putrescine transport system ATP-binding protein